MTQKDLVILEIYNRYSNGELTIEQRDLLFDKCDEVFYESDEKKYEKYFQKLGKNKDYQERLKSDEFRKKLKEIVDNKEKRCKKYISELKPKLNKMNKVDRAKFENAVKKIENFDIDVGVEIELSELHKRYANIKESDRVSVNIMFDRLRSNFNKMTIADRQKCISAFKSNNETVMQSLYNKYINRC